MRAGTLVRLVLSQLRALIKRADPAIVEEVKWKSRSIRRPGHEPRS